MTLVDLYIMEVFDYTKIFACIRGLNAGYGTTHIQYVGLAPKFTIFPRTHTKFLRHTRSPSCIYWCVHNLWKLTLSQSEWIPHGALQAILREPQETRGTR